MLMDAQATQTLSLCIQRFLDFREAALQLEYLRPHLLAQIVDRPLRVLDSYGRQDHHLVELRHIKVHRHLTATHESNMPDEERPYRLGIRIQETLKIEKIMVIERHHHTSFVQSLGIALIVFDGVGIGVEDVRTLQHLF